MRALLSTTRCDWDTSTVVAEITRAALSISLLSVIGSAQRQWAKNPVLLPLLLQLSFHGVVKVCRGGQQPLWAHEQDGTGSAGPIQLREPPGAPLTVILGRGERTRTAIFVGRRTECSLKTPAVQQMCAVTVTGHRPEGRVSLPGSEVTDGPDAASRLRTSPRPRSLRRRFANARPVQSRARSAPRWLREGRQRVRLRSPARPTARPPRAPGGDGEPRDEWRAVKVRGALGKERSRGGVGGGLEPSGTSSGGAASGRNAAG